MSVVAVGNTVRAFRVLRGHKDEVGSSELLAAGPTVFHFYLFDFTGGPGGG